MVGKKILLRALPFAIAWGVAATSASAIAGDRATPPPVQSPRLLDRCTVDEIVFAVRQVDTDIHWYANFGPDGSDPDRKYYHDGGRLCRLSLKNGTVTTLLEDSDGGVRDPQVHYDGQKILFSYRKGRQPYYHLYEIGIDGQGLRQLTRGPYDDIEPTYLPDGDIIFCSSRCQRWVPCYVTQVAVLHRCDASGANIRQLSANTEHENTPCVMPDGRILYQRWEYVDRSQVSFHHLWTMNPDGSAQMVYFGNMHADTLMIDAKPVPGTDQVVASFAPWHGLTEHNGVITIVDPDKGPDAQDMARSISQGGHYRDPYPLSKDLFLVAQESMILLLDRKGHCETIFEMPAAWRRGRMQVHEPQPLATRPRERLVPSQADLTKATGQVVLENVYHGRNMQGVKPGEIKRLLVLEILPKPYNAFSGMEPLSYGGTFLLERVLGTVPVESDGSAYVELPAMRPLFFVALDENDLAVKRMQSFLTLQAGETFSCVGCHEQRVQTPRSDRSLLALRRPPSRIEPLPQLPGVCDFPRDIQPILDKHCTACHDYEATDRGGPMAGGVILSGDHGPMYSHSFYMLTVTRQFSDGRNLRRSNHPPRSIGSSASPLLRKIDGTHYGAQLSDHERRLLALWIDSGAVYAGTYAALGTGSIGHYAIDKTLDRSDLQWPAVQAAQKVLSHRCSTCHQGDLRLPESPSDNKRLVPFNDRGMLLAALRTSQGDNSISRLNRHLIYNLSRPDKSLQLLAPLAKQAGGLEICRSDNGAPYPVFTSTNDPDYLTLLTAVEEGRAYLDRIKRFDMPGFRPLPQYMRELKRYGILPATFDAKTDPIDPYETDRRYWELMWHNAMATR